MFCCVCYIICFLIYKVYFLLSSLSVFSQLVITPYPSAPWPSNFRSGIKTKLKISAGKYKKLNPLGSKAKTVSRKCSDSIKLVVNLPKIQSTREASRDLTLMDNCQTFCSHGSLGLLLCVA